MVVRVSAEWGKRGVEVSREIKMYKQEYDILILGLLYWRDRLVVQKQDDNYLIMKVFQKIIDDIIEEDREWRLADDDDNDDDDDDDSKKSSSSMDELVKEIHQDRENGVIRIEINEYRGVQAISMPTESEDEVLTHELKSGRSFEQLVYTWLQDPQMRDRIRIVPEGGA